MTKHPTMGEVTKSIQGYPTQVWIPTDRRPDIGARIALMHDRRSSGGRHDGFREHEGVYMIPGNRDDRLLRPCSEAYMLNDADTTMDLPIPNAVLWANHGGPCERKGERYGRIRGELMDAAYRALRMNGKPIILPAGRIGKSADFMGPFDYDLTDTGQARPRLTLMDPDLLR